jgi:FkbM family methyltransferase
MGAFEVGRDERGVAGKLAVALRRAVRVSALGAGVVDRLRLFFGTFFLLGSAQTGRRGRDRLVVKLRFEGREARAILSDYSHIHLLELIFVERNYDVSPLGAPKVIVDLGSNIGLSVLFFRLRYPDAAIYGVEPDPVAFALLSRNVAGLATVRHAAVGDVSGVATFWSAPGAVASSLHQTHEAQVPVEVPVRTLSELLADFGVEHVDVLKVVVEGSEFEALRSVDLTRVDAVAGEIVFGPGDRSEESFRALLADYELELIGSEGVFAQYRARRSMVGSAGA